MGKKIERSFLLIHTMHFSVNYLAILNVLYNGGNSGITIPEINRIITRIETFEGISKTLVELAEEIDGVEDPGDIRFTGYPLFFERLNGDIIEIRQEFRRVIAQHPGLRNVMNLGLEKIFFGYHNGLDFQFCLV